MTADPLGRAPALAAVIGGAVLAGGALGWGRPGLLAAALGTGLSLLNVWVLRRFAARAVEAVSATGPAAASSQLTAALGAKTMVLLTCVWLLGRAAALETVPFAFGLLVSVFALLGAGLWSALRGE
jgi:hypothetical protein